VRFENRVESGCPGFWIGARFELSVRVLGAPAESVRDDGKSTRGMTRFSLAIEARS